MQSSAEVLVETVQEKGSEGKEKRKPTTSTMAPDNSGQSPLLASVNSTFCSSIGMPYPPIQPAPAIIPNFPANPGGCAPNLSPGNITLLYRLPHPLSAVLPLLPSFGGSIAATAGEINVAQDAVMLNGTDDAPGTSRRYTGDGGDEEGNYFTDTLTEWQAPRHGDSGANQTPLVVVYSVAPMSLNVSALGPGFAPSSASTGGGGGVGGAAIAAAGGAGAAAQLLSNADDTARPDPYRPFPDQPVIGMYAGSHALVVAPDCQNAGSSSLWNYTVSFCATDATTAGDWFRSRSLRAVRSVADRLRADGQQGWDGAMLDERSGFGCPGTQTGAGDLGQAASNASVAIPGPTGRETGAASSKAYSSRMSMGAAVTLAVAGSIAFAAMMV